MLPPTQAIVALVPLTPAERLLVDELWDPLELGRGEAFLRAPEVSRHVGFLEAGCLHYHVLVDGEPRTYAFAQAGDFVGDYESFLAGRPSDKTIEALEPSRLWRISRDGLHRLYAEVAAGERFGRLAIERVFVGLLAQLTSFYVDGPEARYDQLLRDYPDLVQRVPQYVIAAYVGIRPQSLSRIRRRRSGS